MDEITISTDSDKLDIKFINDFISSSYWGKGRKVEETKKCVKNSLNFGIYLNGKQIGYARIVSDLTVFAYIMDVFITETERGKGYSILLMDKIFNHSELKEVKNWKLSTIDVHILYQKYGFELLKNPQNMMEKNK